MCLVYGFWQSKCHNPVIGFIIWIDTQSKEYTHTSFDIHVKRALHLSQIRLNRIPQTPFNKPDKYVGLYSSRDWFYCIGSYWMQLNVDRALNLIVLALFKIITHFYTILLSSAVVSMSCHHHAAVCIVSIQKEHTHVIVAHHQVAVLSCRCSSSAPPCSNL